MANNTDDKDLDRAFCENALRLLEYEVDDIENSVVGPVDYKYFRNLGRVLQKNGEVSRALTALEKGRDEDAWNSLEENGALFFSEIAQCYYRFKKFNDILMIWSKLTEKYPAGYQIHYTMRLISIIYGKGHSIPSVGG
jgi:tetratricopeptide (TPR) repeat protein